ncbi:MAG: hypothetical protein MRERV_61c005 [Mycoplasmataceae bacterium RV_VA103A]|nr:MAG: hypothetical protein MRERV_61c005 [Mycoplasmataceae bacterium RV_VA103A]
MAFSISISLSLSSSFTSGTFWLSICINPLHDLIISLRSLFSSLSKDTLSFSHAFSSLNFENLVRTKVVNSVTLLSETNFLNVLKASTCSGANLPPNTKRTWFIPSSAEWIPSPIFNKISSLEMWVLSPNPILSITWYCLPCHSKMSLFSKFLVSLTLKLLSPNLSVLAKRLAKADFPFPVMPIIKILFTILFFFLCIIKL